MAQKRNPKQQAIRQKHIPQRTCIACRKVGGKRGLVRLARVDGQVTVDESGKMPGRGAYLHAEASCWDVALASNRIGQALRMKVSSENLSALEEYAHRFSSQDELSLQETKLEQHDGT